MTYIDGYNSFSGDVNIPIIPESMLPTITSGFYQKPNTKGIQVEMEKKGKKEVKPVSIPVSPKSSENLPTNEPVFNFKYPEEGIKKDSDFKKDSDDEVKIFVTKRTMKVEKEKSDDEVSQKQMAKPKSKPVLRKKPPERTWEKYEKKASNRKIERNQCGPGDCEVF